MTQVIEFARLKQITAYRSGAALERLKQITAYQSGTALANHIRDAHQGKFCEECAACREIRERSQP